jgi:hypothetical protein
MIGILGFDSRRGLGIFLLTTASRTALGPAQPPIQWVPGTLSLGVKGPGREAGHSSPSSAEVKECVELYLHSPNTPSWRSVKSTGTTLPLPFNFLVNVLFIYDYCSQIFEFCHILEVFIVILSCILVTRTESETFSDVLVVRYQYFMPLIKFVAIFSTIHT